MNDDLKLLITFLTDGNSMAKVALTIEHGMNGFWGDNYEYFGEPEVFLRYKEIMPLHVRNSMVSILAVETIFEIVHTQEIQQELEQDEDDIRRDMKEKIIVAMKNNAILWPSLSLLYVDYEQTVFQIKGVDYGWMLNIDLAENEMYAVCKEQASGGEWGDNPVDVEYINDIRESVREAVMILYPIVGNMPFSLFNGEKPINEGRVADFIGVHDA